MGWAMMWQRTVESRRERETYRFGDFVVNADTGEIERNGRNQRLEPKVAAVLSLLLRRSGEVVSHDEIMEAVWHDRVVEPVAVARSITLIRQALGDDPKRARYIETVTRRGYRTVARVEPLPLQTRRQRTHALRWGALAFVALVLILVSILGVRTLSTSEAGHIRSLAVMPLHSVSDDVTQAYLAEALTLELHDTLSGIGTLSVVAIRSTHATQRADSTTQSLAQSLGVDGLITGSVNRVGDRVLMELDLIDGVTGNRVWQKAVNRRLSEIADVHGEIARHLATHLEIDLSAAEISRLDTAREVDPEGYADYLRARQILIDPHRPRTQAGREAVQLLESVVARNPRFAEAWAELGHSLSNTGWWSPRSDGEANRNMNRAREAALKALAFDADLPAAHRAMVHAHRFDFDAGKVHLDRALALNPRDPVTLSLYAYATRNVLGEFDRALSMADRAIHYDPLTLHWRRHRADHLVVTRHYQDGLTDFEAIRELFPDPDLEMRAYWALDRHQLWYETQNGLLQTCGPGCAAIANAMNRGWAENEFAGAAHALLDHLIDAEFSARSVAAWAAWVGEDDLAVTWLTRGWQNRETGMDDIKSPFWFDPIRRDPQYQQLLARVGYPEWNPEPGVIADTGRALALRGRTDEAKAEIARALDMAANDSRRTRWLVSMGLAHFANQEYGDAIEWAKRALDQSPEKFAREDAHLLAAASLALLGDTDAADAHLQAVLATWPDLSARFAPLPPFTETNIRERYVRGLIESGLPQ